MPWIEPQLLVHQIFTLAPADARWQKCGCAAACGGGHACGIRRRRIAARGGAQAVFIGLRPRRPGRLSAHRQAAHVRRRQRLRSGAAPAAIMPEPEKAFHAAGATKKQWIGKQPLLYAVVRDWSTFETPAPIRRENGIHIWGFGMAISYPRLGKWRWPKQWRDSCAAVRRRGANLSGVAIYLGYDQS